MKENEVENNDVDLDEKETAAEDKAEGETKEYQDYEIKSWAQTILDAEKIKKDSVKMVAVKKYLNEHGGEIKSAISSLAELKKKANSLK